MGQNFQISKVLLGQKIGLLNSFKELEKRFRKLRGIGDDDAFYWGWRQIMTWVSSPTPLRLSGRQGNKICQTLPTSLTRRRKK